MLRDDRVFCDDCGAAMGKWWNLPAQAPRLLSAPRLDFCPDCVDLVFSCPRAELLTHEGPVSAKQKEGGTFI